MKIGAVSLTTERLYGDYAMGEFVKIYIKLSALAKNCKIFSSVNETRTYENMQLFLLIWNDSEQQN